MNSRQMVTHHRSKRARTGRRFGEKYDLFDQLSDDVASFLLSKLSSSVSRPSDFFNLLLTCKRMKRLALDPLVLSNSGPKMFAVKARSWSESSHLFLKRCADAGSPEASYTLGMIRFYCLQNWSSGASLMAKAAVKSHALALYSLAVIQFNGSGGGGGSKSKSKKNLPAGVALCQRAALLGHLNALRELGHCVQDGYGVPQNVPEGRRLLTLANTREFALSFNSFLSRRQKCSSRPSESCACVNADVCSLLSEFVGNVPAEEAHPANQFLTGWFDEGRGLGDGLRLCSYGGCGRPETRQHEFRRCSVCCTVNYCSRGCQAMDWKVKHRKECLPANEEHLELDFVEMEEEEVDEEEAAAAATVDA